MIELKNITKIYKGKGGVSVKALDDVSLTLPDKGMVFILGKSGCGKSTMLNILGGLDYPTSGELTVKGRSSGTFKAADYDSYRNTCVGFIFQEYNVLPEFSVKQNIVLASELRDDKDFEGRFNDVLGEVELTGLESRKPGTLSGGQKQRVAIARALIKNPEIILADEPTGALDSATGQAVLNTLKRLSENKLVVVVSHDREFAENYADRIVELFDGRIVSDRTRKNVATALTDKVTVMDDGIHLIGDADEQLLATLNELLKDKQTVTITREDDGARVYTGSFAETVPDEVPQRFYTAEEQKFIRSRFPLRYAIRMGASGMKTKPFRLILTIFLATVALTAFGFMLTLMSFNADKVLRNALNEGGLTEIGVAGFHKDGDTSFFALFDNNSTRRRLSGDEIKALEERTGLEYLKVHFFGDNYYMRNLDFPVSYNSYDSDFRNYYYPESFCGFSNAKEDELKEFGAELVKGKMPENSDEIVISEWMVSALYNLKATDPEGELLLPKENSDPVGLVLEICGVPLKICGVFKCPTPDSRYDGLKDCSDPLYNYSILVTTDKRIQKLSTLSEELETIYRASLCTLILTDDGFYNEHIEDFSGEYYKQLNAWMTPTGEELRMIGVWGEGVKLSTVPEDLIVTRDGKTPEKGTILLTDAQLKDVVYQVLASAELTDAQRKQYSDQFDGYMYDPDFGKDTVLKIFDLIDEVLPGALDDVEINMNATGKSFECRIGGCFFTGEVENYNNQYFILTDEDYEYFFPMGGYDLTSADFLLTPNTAAARKTLTDKKFRDENRSGDCYDLYANYQESKVTEYSMFVNIFSRVFLWVGIFHALFASLLLFNFISVSINYKKKDIGILRALGARKVDIFKVFFSESMIIIGICFALSATLSLILSLWFNAFLKRELSLTASLFFFGPLQALILGALATFVAFISTVLPVHHHAKKPPVDSIRAL